MSDSILLLHEHLAPLAAAFGATPAHRGWEPLPPGGESDIRAIVMGGEFPLDRALAERLPKLGLIACIGAGYDGVDVAWARGRGLEVTHAPQVNASDVADHALGLVLASRRGILVGDRALRTGGWTRESRIITRGVGGQRVGVVGLGAIGVAVARRCEACEMSVSWWGPREKPDARWARADSLQALASASDVLVVCARAEESNRGLISREVLEALGPKALLVNVSRGQVVDEAALIEALRTGTLGAAALDVFAEEPTPAELWADVPNTVLTPHMAGSTAGAVQTMVRLLVENVSLFLAGQPVRTPVPG